MSLCTCTFLHASIHRVGNMYAVLHRQMRITFGVIANLFGKVIRQIFDTANQFWLIANRISNGFAKRPFFCPHPFYRQNFPFLDKFYV